MQLKVSKSYPFTNINIQTHLEQTDSKVKVKHRLDQYYFYAKLKSDNITICSH